MKRESELYGYLHYYTRKEGMIYEYADFISSFLRYTCILIDEKGITTECQYVNGQLLGEKRSTGVVLRYTYDPLGALSSIQYTNGGGTWHNYYVRCTLSGDVDQIYSGSGNLVARYVYDTWGNTVSITDANGNAITSSTHIANINSIRYRGYYWDRETGFYYLQSRYYDPETKRFVNPDSYVFTGQDMQSGNMYAYCGNNPTGRSDVEGSAYQVDYGGLNGSFGGSMLWPTYSMPVPIAPAIGVAVGSLAVATAAILTTAINPPQPWQMSSAALSSYQTSKAKAQSTDVATTTTKPRNDETIYFEAMPTRPGATVYLNKPLTLDSAVERLYMHQDVYARTESDAIALCMAACGGFTGPTNDNRINNAFHFHPSDYRYHAHVYFGNDPHLKFVAFEP